ncbi:PREDICTED: uncharacterized protein LOC109359653 [Lupinus angustifolius]|uniref:uncharacterized protein LOC109359653 n=1 Tax=Lupinus angustifolius TaxID=3871 RepID=UPI00092E8913|nr:PREDICTED: uncharacterized protein LOC109359653 [Lupinus angustifolius]
MALKIEEEFWREKARVIWHTSGDRNTTYFHKVAKIRKVTKSLTLLRDGENNIWDLAEIANHAVSYFKTLYASDNQSQPNDLIQLVIPNVVTESDNCEGAPGPDGFGGCFYQEFWEIVGVHVYNSVTQFFTQSWLLPNHNSNSVVLIPKFPRADKIEDFRPIALANFQFKVISKVLAYRLAIVAPINLLDHKTFGGNLAIKLDVRKAFDTIDWDFLLDTLHAFGFDSKFIHWIKVILTSAKLSIVVNGHSVRFFPCKRGVRQGDPFSPLLFCLAEDVLSRGLKREILALNKLISTYAQASGQHINLDKCKFYYNEANARKLSNLSSWLGFTAGRIPCYYLGVPLFRGKPMTIHLKPLADRIITKLSKWKGSFLSIMGRVELVKSIIHNMLAYSFHVYAWPLTLLKSMDQSIRNFIWSGDLKVRKIVTVAWDKLCYPVKEGGLGLRSTSDLNQAAILKLAWGMKSSNQEWASFYRLRFYRAGDLKASYVKSPVWPGIKKGWQKIIDNAIWLVGNGSKIRFWTDNWLGEPLADTLSIPPQTHSTLAASVADFIHDQKWTIPSWMAHNFPSITDAMATIQINQDMSDELVWKHSTNGKLTLKTAYSFFKPRIRQLSWCKLIWSSSIPPTKSFNTWRLVNNKMPTDENLQKRGIPMASICTLCHTAAENSPHLFLHCSYAFPLWNWLENLLGKQIDRSSVSALLHLPRNTWSHQLTEVILAYIVCTISTIWHCRNQGRFEDKSLTTAQALAKIQRDTAMIVNLSKATANPSMEELIWLRAFRVHPKYTLAPVITEVRWLLPNPGWVKINTDGAAHGSPGHAGGGGIFRDCHGEMLGCFAIYMNIQDSLYAELFAAILAISMAKWKDVTVARDATNAEENDDGSWNSCGYEQPEKWHSWAWANGQSYQNWGCKRISRNWNLDTNDIYGSTKDNGRDESLYESTTARLTASKPTSVAITVATIAITTSFAAATTTTRKKFEVGCSCFDTTGGITVYNGSSTNEQTSSTASYPSTDESTNSDEPATDELRSNSCCHKCWYSGTLSRESTDELSDLRSY